MQTKAPGRNNTYKKKVLSLGLPSELSEKVWLHENGVLTSMARRWRFHENGIYQVQQDSDRQLLIFLRDEGIHHVFRSYRASWLTTFTDAQLIGREVLEMSESVMPCPHCGGKELQVELIRDSLGVGNQFVGRVCCKGSGSCGAITSWRIGISREAMKQELLATRTATATATGAARGKASTRGKASGPNPLSSLTQEEVQALQEKLAREFLLTLWNERAIEERNQGGETQ